MTSPRHAARTFLAASLATALAACSIPAKLAPPLLNDQIPLAGLPVHNNGHWPDAEWWHQYHDSQLNALMDRAMTQAPDLALAQSRLRNAEQSARAAAAQAGMQVNGSAQVQRQRLSEHGFIPTRFLGFNWYNQGDLGIQLQYDFDWWGKQRAQVEAAVDQSRAAQAQQSAAAIAVQYAVADTYFSWQADQARLQLADQSLTVQQRLLSIAQLRARQGVDDDDNVQKAQAQLAYTQEMHKALDGSAKIRLATLAALVGCSPAELPALSPRPLPAVQDGLPPRADLDLIARRPDIAASRWKVEAALRQTDVARAEFLPDLSINALAGLSSIDLDKLITRSSRVFNAAPALHLPLFSGGRLEANYGISKAQLQGAVAQYQSAVLNAAREVSTQALTLETLDSRQQQQQQQVAADERLAATAQVRLRQGVRDARESLITQAQLLQQRDSALQVQAQAVSADLSLIKALGGGYHMPSPTTTTLPSGAAP